MNDFTNEIGRYHENYWIRAGSYYFFSSNSQQELSNDVSRQNPEQMRIPAAKEFIYFTYVIIF